MHALAAHSALRPVATGSALYHKGFALSVGPEANGQFGYTIRHRGLTLCTSGGSYATSAGAERAARRHVDDALGAFERQTAPSSYAA